MNDINEYIAIAEESMEKAIEHLIHELAQIRTGKASPSILGGIMVSYYGTPTPLNQVANVATADARTITIQPWEKKMLGPIEKAIFESNLGLTPMNDGELIRIGIPPLTEERRKDFVKKAKALGEDAKISVRNARRDAMEYIKKSVKDGFPEDAGKKLESDVQDITNTFNEKVDKLILAKEKDIMTI
jgi:ribosome recycling factor